MPITAQAAGVKAGAIADFAGTTAPAGWLIADGSAISRTLYSALFSYCGTTHGAGDGTTTFNIPDCRGEFRRGLDNGRGIDTSRVLGSAQTDQMQSHKHGLNGRGGGGTVQLGIESAKVLGVSHGALNFAYDYGGQTIVSSPYDDGNGTPRTGLETRPRNKAFLTCIKF